jgi:predicted transcriptional regulator
MGLSLTELDPPLDDVAFVARSNNRVDVLEALAESDLTRRALREATDISQPTIGRILEGFEERGWVSNGENGNGSAYRLTPLGRLLAEAFESLLDTVGTIQTLQGIAPRLPLDEMDFDLRALADARITTPGPTDATAHFRRETEVLAQTTRLQFLCNQAQPETVERYRDWVVEDDGELEAVITGDAIDAARAHPMMGRHVGEMLASGRATVYRYDGDVSFMAGMLDDTASIVPLDDSGVPCAFVESNHDAVREWVTDTFESYREQATPLPAEGLRG